MKTDLKIVFFGREFGLVLKEKLENAGFCIINPDSPAWPAGRPKMDLIVVGFYGKILSKKILETPRYGALNVHPSLLPKYRGPTPVQTAILNGETKTGVTIIRMDEQIDHGPILASREFPISNFSPYGESPAGRQFSNGPGKPNTPELTKILWELGGDLLVETIPKWIAGKITPKEQDHAKATYTKILTREDGHIDWTKTAEEIERQIRALAPWPGSFTFYKNMRLKIISGYVRAASQTDLHPGQVSRLPSGAAAVGTGQGIFVIETLQLAGKSETSSKFFLDGHSDIIDAALN